MKIEDNRPIEKKDCFANLEPGDCFTHTGRIYMKTDEEEIIRICKINNEKTWVKINAVNVETGVFTWIDPCLVVKYLNTKLVID